MAKATRCYVHGLRKSRDRDYPAPGGSWSSEFALPFPLWESELQQMEQGDIPYFFQFLGKDLKPSSWKYTGLTAFHRTTELLPFWGKCIEAWIPSGRSWNARVNIEVLVRSLADAVAFVAPQEPFDLRDDHFGLRVFRTQKDKELWFVAF